MSYKIDLSRFELVLGGEYIKYYAVNLINSPIAPFGISGKPLTLHEAKEALKTAIEGDPKNKYHIEEVKLHISFFDGYQHLSPYFNNKDSTARGIND